MAAASIGQVHRATLLTGEKVAVKVQRPGIRKMIAEDLAILYHLAMLLENYIDELKLYRPTRIVEEFARTIRKEINFNVEASHAERRQAVRGQRRRLRPPDLPFRLDGPPADHGACGGDQDQRRGSPGRPGV